MNSQRLELPASDIVPTAIVLLALAASLSILRLPH